MYEAVKHLMMPIWNRIYPVTLALLYPLNCLLCSLRKNVKYENSVLHISYMVHIPYYTVKILRKHGMKADYLAVGTSPYWDKSDYCFVPAWRPHIRAIKEFLFFWKVIAKYEVIHSHFMITMSQTGWEYPFLKKMGRKIFIHYRGCEIRDRDKNMKLQPEWNICQDCDYNEASCSSEMTIHRRRLSEKYGDKMFVTTPDLKDFVPYAIHFPLFAPDIPEPHERNLKNGDTIRVVHATVHPGLEGTKQIEKAIENLKTQGYKINFVFLKNVRHAIILEEYKDADIAIGKMKMGYYANAQIESMTSGVPTITYVRPDFMSVELKDSGFIFSSLGELESTLKFYLDNPDQLQKKREIARKSILQLHDNDKLALRLIEYYKQVKNNKGK